MVPSVFMHIPGGSFIFNISFMGQPSFLILINSPGDFFRTPHEPTILPTILVYFRAQPAVKPFFPVFLPVGKNRTGRRQIVDPISRRQESPICRAVSTSLKGSRNHQSGGSRVLRASSAGARYKTL